MFLNTFLQFVYIFFFIFLLPGPKPKDQESRLMPPPIINTGHPHPFGEINPHHPNHHIGRQQSYQNQGRMPRSYPLSPTSGSYGKYILTFL